jgi:hypothetical protein
MDLLNFIMQVEQDPSELTIEEYVDGIAYMVKHNIVQQLQGSWQRAAWPLIEAGIINKWGDVIAYPEV